MIIAGIHGVGKSYLCIKDAKSTKVIYKSTSDIIRERIQNFVFKK